MKMNKSLITSLSFLLFSLLLFACNNNKKINEIRTQHEIKIKLMRLGFEPLYSKVPDSMKKWIKVFSNVLADDQKNRIIGVNWTQEELKEQKHLDSQNLIIVTNYLDKKGWPAKYDIGFIGQRAIGMVIQHSSLNIQEKYYPSLISAYNRDSFLFENLALLEDRINMRNHRYQYYGTQVVYFNHKLVPYPVMNIDSIEIYRNKLGRFMPFEKYLKFLGANPDIKEYKRILPDLIKSFKLSDTLGIHYQKVNGN
jgi:hypothetical protein